MFGKQKQLLMITSIKESSVSRYSEKILQFLTELPWHFVASARMRSGAVKLSRSHNVILVLDISERMTSYFQKLKSAALQYVYGEYYTK